MEDYKNSMYNPYMSENVCRYVHSLFSCACTLSNYSLIFLPLTQTDMAFKNKVIIYGVVRSDGSGVPKCIDNK